MPRRLSDQRRAPLRPDRPAPPAWLYPTGHRPEMPPTTSALCRRRTRAISQQLDPPASSRRLRLFPVPSPPRASSGAESNGAGRRRDPSSARPLLLRPAGVRLPSISALIQYQFAFRLPLVHAHAAAPPFAPPGLLQTGSCETTIRRAQRLAETSPPFGRE